MKAWGKYSLAPSRRAAALVIILAFVVLLAVLVLAFFSRAALDRQISNASAGQTKAEILARGAVEVIIGDLRQEIAARSTIITNNGITLFYPLDPADMIPARSGNPAFAGATNDPVANLVRRSVRGDSLAASLGTVPASAVNSTNAAANGRMISRSRWNSHYLLPRLNAGSDAIDPTPVSAFEPPDWVMVDRNGPVVITSPDPGVIGRFAFVIYDEGGLLDANAVGYPSGLSASVASLKGSPGFADLSMIGITNANDLVGWRNYATMRPAGKLGAYTFGTEALDNYAAFLTNGTNAGFTRVSTNSAGNRTDQHFSSRQALLRFHRAARLPQDALQFLGTHTRTPEQPSFRPDPGRPKNTGADVRTSDSQSRFFGGNDSFDPTGALPDRINPFLLLPRDADGHPVFKKRFPLSRLGLIEAAHLALLAGEAVPSSLAEDIRREFGLVWNASNARWDYLSPTGIATASPIATLDEVAEQGREPDFFETLKASIECGSLGKQHGGNDGTGSPSRYISYSAAYPYAGRDGFIDLQIFAIGANLIDQYDADSYPTRIFSGAGPANAPPARLTCGIENIPALAGAMTAWYRLGRLSASDIDSDEQPPAPDSGGNGMPYETAVLIQPILWNPHAPNTSASSHVPAHFQIQMGAVNSFQSDADGAAVSMRPQVRSAWWLPLAADGFGTANATSFPAADGLFSYPLATLDPAVNRMQFTFVPGAFDEPYRIHLPDDPPGSNATADPAGTIVTNDLGSSDLAIGFFAGMTWTGPVAARHPNAGSQDSVLFRSLASGRLSQNAAMRLQYRNPYSGGPGFLTYKVIDFLYLSSDWYSTVDADPAFSGGDPAKTPFNRGLRTLFLADPRTSRWGAPSLNVCPYDWLGVKPEGVSAPSSGPRIPPVYPLPQRTTLGPDGVSTVGISYRLMGDNAGAVPKASGWRYFGGGGGRQNIADLQVNLRDGSDASPVPGRKFFYTDPDGVLRRADGGFFLAASGDGLPLRTGNNDSRPVILNRPFRSIAEMGYAFRDMPWKSLDFAAPESGDAALLDAFCLAEIETTDSVPLVAGRVNLNTRQPRVLAALINGVSKAEGGLLTGSEALAAANRLVEWTSDTTTKTEGLSARGPLRNRSELVGKFLTTKGAGITGFADLSADVPNIEGSKAYAGYSSFLTNGVFSSASDFAIKRRHESVIRALVDSGQVRSWNLLIDVVAQTGRFSQSAGADLGRFVVEGERRFWVHVSIDRFTGEILYKDVETVTDP